MALPPRATARLPLLHAACRAACRTSPLVAREGRLRVDDPHTQLDRLPRTIVDPHTPRCSVGRQGGGGAEGRRGRGAAEEERRKGWWARRKELRRRRGEGGGEEEVQCGREKDVFYCQPTKGYPKVNKRIQDIDLDRFRLPK